MRKRFLLLLPAALLAVIIGAALALPGFVAAQDNRPAIERLASALTGRDVHIAGKLSLTLLPHPRLTATNVTISGPDREVISARALSMDIALPALLRGQIAVQTLDLDSPVIDFPWPLPGGPAAVAPPPWLAALHAHLTNAHIAMGRLVFSKVDADLYTGQDGTVSLSGNGVLLGRSVTLSLALGPLGDDGAAPLSVEGRSGALSARFSGALTGASTVSGTLNAALPGKAAASATLGVDGETLALAGLKLSAGDARLEGSAGLDLAAKSLTANLLGRNLDLDRLAGLPGWASAIPAQISLNAANVTLRGQRFPALSVDFATAPTGTKVQMFSLSLPGGGTLTGHGEAAPGGALRGQLSLNVPDGAALLAAFHLPPLPAGSAHVTAALAGTASLPMLQDLSGTLGGAHVTGNLVLGWRRLAGRLAFDELDLAPLAAWAGRDGTKTFSADLEITAAKAEAGPLKLTNLAIDAALDGTLNVRRISAALYGGLAAGSFTLDSGGRISSAEGFLDLPSASPLGALIPPAYAPPAALLKPRLALRFAASGPADALAASAVLRLGEFTVTTTPVIDLIRHSAAGALTAQHPEAILVARLFGFDHGLIFPGAGSASLRAGFSAGPGRYGLDDFVANFGALTASGRVMVQKGAVSGEIDAGTIALPPLPAKLQFPASLPLQGSIALRLRQLVYDGQDLTGPGAAKLSWSGRGAVLDLSRTAYGKGDISGSLDVNLAPKAAPAFSAKILLRHVDATTLAPDVAFPLPVTAGTVDGNAALTAAGYGLKSLLATLGGTVSLTVADGEIGGFDLPGFTAALGAPGAAQALAGGHSAFTSLKLDAAIKDGNCTLTSAVMSSPAGTVEGSGGIDLYDEGQALKLGFAPSVSPPLTAGMLVLGSWAKPKITLQAQDAPSWLPAPPPLERVGAPPVTRSAPSA